MKLKRKSRKLRPVGEITADLEKLWDELFIDHDMEWGEVLGITLGFWEVHYPDNKETCAVTGKHPKNSYKFED